LREEFLIQIPVLEQYILKELTKQKKSEFVKGFLLTPIFNLLNSPKSEVKYKLCFSDLPVSTSSLLAK